jgi:hypothetical protein
MAQNTGAMSVVEGAMSPWQDMLMLMKNAAIPTPILKDSCWVTLIRLLAELRV